MQFGIFGSLETFTEPVRKGRDYLVHSLQLGHNETSKGSSSGAERFFNVLQALAPLAHDHGVTLVIEPLNRQECKWSLGTQAPIALSTLREQWASI